MKAKLLLVFLAFFVCFPAIVLEYGMHDDYRYLGSGIDKKDIWKLHPDMSPGVACGRPVAMFFIGIQSLVTDKIRDFTWQRFVFFGSTLFCALCVYYYLTRRLLLDSFFAACLVFCIFTLPQSQFFVLWSVWSVFAGPALFLAILSYLIFDYAWSNFFLCRRWKSYAICLFISFCVLLLSLYDYPVMTLFFLVFSCANILFSKFNAWPKTGIRVIHEILFCCLGMAVYLITYKLIYVPLVLTLFPHLEHALSLMTSHRVEISLDVSLKISRFWAGSVLSLGSVFHPLFGHVSAIFVFIFLSLGCVAVFVVYLFRAYRSRMIEGRVQLQELNWILQMILAILIILPLSVAPVLATITGFTYRLVFPYSAIIVLLIFWILLSLSRIFAIQKAQSVANYVALLIVIVFGILAQICMSNTALSANRELVFIRQKLASVDFSKVSELVCLKPNRWPGEYQGTFGQVEPVFGDLPQRHEYDHMATNRAFMEELFQAVLAEMDVKRTIPVKSYELDTYHFSVDADKAYTVNMNEIIPPDPGNNFAFEAPDRPIKNVDGSQCVLFKLYLQTDGWHILDFYPNFWEEAGDFPHWVSFEFNDPRPVLEYALQTGPFGQDDTGRMPQDWLLQGSDDGEKWIDLDKRSGETGWKNNERRVYTIANPSTFRKCRFYCIKGNNPGIFRLNNLELKLSGEIQE
jgi:hypothetical protein